MTDIYVLALNNGKYYVGKSDDVNRRLRVHQSGNGSVWTRIHKPIKILQIKKNAGKFDEDSTTLELMEKYGIQNVRGGTYSNLNLEDYQIEEINEKISHSNDLCLRCGRKGHFVSQCYAKTHINGSSLEHSDDDDDDWDDDDDDDDDWDDDDDDDDDWDDDDDDDDDWDDEW